MSTTANEYEEVAALPTAPTGGGAAPTGPTIDGDYDEDVVNLAPRMGDAIPVGTYHFRLDRFLEGWQGKDDEGVDPTFGPQPYFMIFWKCQEEPHVGRSFLDFVPWVTKEVFEGAKAGNQAAVNLVKDRLWKSRSIKEGCSYNMPGKGNFKDFMNTNPECKIRISVKEKKVAGKGTGEMQNQAQKYMPLHQV